VACRTAVLSIISAARRRGRVVSPTTGSQELLPATVLHDEARTEILNGPRGREAACRHRCLRRHTQLEGTSSLARQYALDGIHDGRIGVSGAIRINLLLILVECLGLDDRVAHVLAVVVSAKPHHDGARGRRQFVPVKLIAGNFSKVQRLLRLHRRDLCRQE
jgi:hypothetical protein